MPSQNFKHHWTPMHAQRIGVRKEVPILTGTLVANSSSGTIVLLK